MRTSANSIVEETAEILSETLAEPLLFSHGSSVDNIYQLDLPDEGNQRVYFHHFFCCFEYKYLHSYRTIYVSAFDNN